MALDSAGSGNTSQLCLQRARTVKSYVDEGKNNRPAPCRDSTIKGRAGRAEVQACLSEDKPILNTSRREFQQDVGPWGRQKPEWE